MHIACVAMNVAQFANIKLPEKKSSEKSIHARKMGVKIATIVRPRPRRMQLL